MKNLSQLCIGEKAVVASIRFDAPSNHLLSALGLIPGAPLEVRRCAPLGDPISLAIGGTQISLRKADAADVTVEVHQ